MGKKNTKAPVEQPKPEPPPAAAETTLEDVAAAVNDVAKRVGKLEKGDTATETEIERRLREVEQAVGLTPKSVSLKDIRDAVAKEK